MKKDIIRVFTTNLIKTLVTFITVFFIPMLLSLEQYGYYKLFSLYTSYIGVSHLGFCDGIFLKYGGSNLEYAEKDKLAGEQKTFFLYEFLLTATVTSIGVWKQDVILCLFGLSFLPVTMITFYTYLYQSAGIFRKYAKIYNLNSILLLAGNIFFVFILKAEKGIYYAGLTVAVNYTVFLFAFLDFQKNYHVKNGKISVCILRDHMKAGILLMLGNMSYILFSGIDKWFVKFLLKMECFAYYSFAVQLLSVINMFVNPIGLTFYNYMSRFRKENFEYTMKTRMLSILFFMLTFVFVIKFIVVNFMEKYVDAVSVIEILFLAQVFLLLNTTVYVNLFKVYQMQKEYFFNVIIVIVVSIFLNTLFYIGMGKSMQSFAFATLCSMILWALCNLRYFPYLRLKKDDLWFAGCCCIFYGLANQIGHIIFAGCFYLISWIILLRLFMEGNFKYYTEQMFAIRDKIWNRMI